MKRLCTVLSLILVLVVLALPAVARADNETSFAPAGWTWDEATAPAETSSPVTDGWTWDEL
jgi:hypothetical protein